ncbi:MAG: hypothetical protein ACXWWU_03325 [Candidatus Limnocylindria bacterium]
MRRSTSLLALFLLGFAACAPAGSSGASQPGPSQSAKGGGGQPTPSQATSSEPSAPASPAPSGGAPIGTWSLSLGGVPPVAGDYAGRDEMICTGLEGGPWAVSFNPVGSDPVGHVDAVIDQEGNRSLLVSAGGLEAGGTYVAGDATAGTSAEVLEGPTVEGNVLHLKMHGVDLLKRTIDLTVDCPLFPADTGG